MKRDVQLAIVEGMERPVGTILPSVIGGTNADLIAAVAPLYLNGLVLDCTYGEGAWWKRFRPSRFVAHDLHKGDGVDFTALPEPDGTYDAVCFDPPYIPQGGLEHSTVGQFTDAFGLESRSRDELDDLIAQGIAECARVLAPSGYLLAKCGDYVNGGAFHLGHATLIRAAERCGLYVHDLIIHHTGAGPGGHNIFEVQRARRHHSYLVVLRHPEAKWLHKRKEQEARAGLPQPPNDGSSECTGQTVSPAPSAKSYKRDGHSASVV